MVDVSVDAGPAPAASAAATCVHEDILAEFTRLSGHPEAIQSVLMDACELLPAAPSVEASCPQAQPSQTFDDCVR